MTAELSGVDLARQALVSAREAAKKNGATRKAKPKRRTGTVVRRDGREPLGLGAAIGMMMTERGMVAPAAGGSVLARFDDILAAAAPELAGHVQAVKFDADTGRLDVAPDAPAFGTKLRWSTPKLIAAANKQVADVNVRTLRVLPPAPVQTGPAAAAADPAPQPAAPAAPVERRTPPPGYLRALAAHRASRTPTTVDATIPAAAERQTRQQAREPEELFGDGQAALQALRHKATKTSSADATRVRALKRLADERAGRLDPTPRQRRRSA
ncbi:DciA family protein [Streptomyces sioyaensis]|uniref:DciA family protein n=1 Tax=Streptomyces sioyaensis TaxID=67364 RepID=UPI003D742129